MLPDTLRVVECPRANCGKLRSMPCAPTCYLASASHLNDLEREARLAAERRERALQRIEEYHNGTDSHTQ